MVKVIKLSTVVLIFYMLFYLQIWGDNHLILYATAAISVLSMLFHCMHSGSLAFDRVPYGIWSNLILAVYTLVTGFFVAADFMVPFRSSITLLAFAVVCIAISYASAEEGSFEWILKVIIAVALLCSVYTLVRGKEWSGYGITMSAINNPHDLAAVLSHGVFSVTYLSRGKERKFSFFSAALIFLFMIVTILCGSRKYLLASTLIAGIWVWAVVREEWKSENSSRRIIMVFMLIGLAGVAYYVFSHVYLGSDSQIRMQASNDMGNQNRILFYEKAWKIFLDHPFLGGGLNEFRYLSGTGMYAHSTYAEAIADLGFVGSVLYFTPIIATTYRIIRKVMKPDRNYGDFLLLAFCLSELFIGTMQIFFMEFHHFIVWSILFFYDRPDFDFMPRDLEAQKKAGLGKFIRQGRPVMDSLQKNLSAQQRTVPGKYIR